MNKTVKTIRDFSIEAIAESGQVFRITRRADAWRVIAHGRVLDIRETGSGAYAGRSGKCSNESESGRCICSKEDNGYIYSSINEFDCSEEEFSSVWHNYFDLDTDYDEYRRIVLPEDEYMQKALHFGSGIRLLRQDPWEMLISFIISQRKSVPAIRTSVERLSASFGRPIGETGEFAFPTAAELAQADEEALAACGLGYRVPYVRSAAELVADGRLKLTELAALDTQTLIEALMELKGVGIKVASCVALFGYYRIDTVPVDVWMKRVIDKVYNGALPEEYKPYAGVLQQYMFNYARLNRLGA